MCTNLQCYVFVCIAVVLNLFYAISHFATPNLNIPPLPRNEFLALCYQHHSKVPQLHATQSEPLCLLDIMHKIQTNFIVLRVANIVFQTKSRNFAKCSTYTLPQAIGLPRHRRNQLSGSAFPVFPSLSQGQRKFLQNKV